MEKYKLTAKARSDLKEIGRYTERIWGLNQAGKYLGELYVSFDKLADNPTFGRPQEHLSPGLRKYAVQKHYIFYRSAEHGIEVIRVLHQSRDVPRHFK